MARRVTTARDQVEMLSPWRTASPANGYDLMRDSMFKRLNREYHAWYEGNGDPRLESGGNGPLSSWRNIENFLRDNYPESHRGLNAGMESVGGLLDGGTVKDLPGYETGPDAEALHGYDPREVTATMLLLHNMSHGNRDDRYDLDVDRLAEIARIRSEMQRAHEQRTSSWRNTPDRPPTPIPPRDLLPHRQLNPAIMTPQDMQQSLYYPVYDESVPAPPPNPNRQYSDDPYNSEQHWWDGRVDYDHDHLVNRSRRPSGFERSKNDGHGFIWDGRGGGTEHGMVERLESGGRLDPVELITNGVGATLTDGNHRLEVADMMSQPTLDTHVHYEPHERDEWHRAPVDPDGELGRLVRRMVQDDSNYTSFDELNHSPGSNEDEWVFRKNPATGLWERGNSSPWSRSIADTKKQLRKRAPDGPAHEWDGPGEYYNWWGPNGQDVMVHRRNLFGRLDRAAAIDEHEGRGIDELYWKNERNDGYYGCRTASTLFDWRRSPEYDSPGITVDHHSAPLENGDRLHAYRMDVSTPHWVFEIGPHDMPNRFPLRWIPGHLVPEGFSHTTYGMVIGRDPEVDPPGTDRRRRNNSLWGRYLDDPTHPSGKRHENGETYRTLAEAAEAAERRYLEEAPGWGQREPHRRDGFGYDAFFDRGLGGGNPGDGYSDVDEFPEEIP